MLDPFTSLEVRAEPTPLDIYVDFYSSLASLTTRWFQGGLDGIGNPHTYIFSSIANTFDSIRTVYQKDRIGDAYSLLRKYQDLATINVYTMLYLNDRIAGFTCDSEESIQDMARWMFSGDDPVRMWLSNKGKCPAFQPMSTEIGNSNTLKPLNSILRTKGLYKKIRDRCNDFTHFNSFQCVLINDREVRVKARPGFRNAFLNDVEDLFVFHFSSLF